MKKTLCCLSLFLSAGSTWAIEPVTPQAACARLQPESNEQACYVVIANSKFDEFAVGVCDDLKSSKETLNCMREIQNGTFESHKAIRVCARLETPSNIIECMGAINFEHIDDRAVLACDRIKDSDTTLSCMEAIAGKRYTQGEIDECNQLASAEDTADCFEDNGKENPNDFELGGRRAAAAAAAAPSTGKKRTLDLSQFVKQCPPDKQDSNSDVSEKLKHWDDIVRRASSSVK